MNCHGTGSQPFTASSDKIDSLWDISVKKTKASSLGCPAPLKVLEQHISSSTKSDYVWAPLVAAASRGHLNAVKLLLSISATIKTTDRNDALKTNALLEAIRNGHQPVALHFIASGFDLEYEDWRGETALSLALTTPGSIPLLRSLITNGAVVKPSMLLSVSQAQDIELVEAIPLLIESGIPINTADSSGESGLFKAVRGNNWVVVKTLIDLGIDIDVKNKQNETALIVSIRKSDMCIIHTLLEAGAQADTLDRHSQSALSLAIASRRFDVANLLLDFGADVHAVNRYGRTPVMEAAVANSSQLISQLTLLGAKLDLDDHCGETPFSSLKNYHTKWVETALVMIRCGADPSWQNRNSISFFDVLKRCHCSDCAHAADVIRKEWRWQRRRLLVLYLAGNDSMVLEAEVPKKVVFMTRDLCRSIADFL